MITCLNAVVMIKTTNRFTIDIPHIQPSYNGRNDMSDWDFSC